jgi:two-component system, cell cycle sensor histidine kinase and response regulator CckA
MDSKARRVDIGKILASDASLFIVSFFLIAIIFLIDVYTLYGAIHWILYIIPLILIYRTEKISYVTTILITVFFACLLGATVTGPIPTAEDLPLLDMVSRTEGLVVFILFTWIIIRLINSRRHFKDLSAKMAQSEETHRALVEGLPDVIRRLDLDGRHLFVSKNACEFFDSAADQFIGRTNRELGFSDEFCRMWDEGIREVVATGQPYERQYVFEGKQGPRSFDWRLVPEFDGAGEVKGVISINRDITERRRNAEALAAEREKLRVTLLCIGDGVITTDAHGNVDMMNGVAEELCGWRQNEAQGKPLSLVFTIVNEITRESLMNPFQEVLASGIAVELENHTLLIAKHGAERIIADSASPIRDKNKGIVGVVIVFRDITERQKLIEAMNRNQNLESLGMLAGGIAHDFNNLMGGIFGYIELAMKEPAGDNGVQYLSNAMATISRARSLTRQLLTFAKGGFPVRKLDSLFPLVRETAQFALSGSNVSCGFDVPDDLWPCNFDAGQISQVIDNIVINAQQAMPGGGNVEISAKNVSLKEKEHLTLPAGGYVRISITDRGAGIPKEIRHRIFDPFFSTKAKGHGIGLATCYSIVNRHGGCIDVESEPGKGCTFRVFIPAFGDSVSSVTKEAVSEHEGNGTILIMDDEPVIRETMRIILQSFGYSVISTSNGQEAIACFLAEAKANRKFAGMIFDLTVPGGMGGKEAIKEIRKVDPEIPAFVASGYTDNPVIANPGEFGFTASISKPFTRDELAKMLNSYMPKQE